ncbi:MAG: DNA polymerase/3'-5' exonuclease PolX [Candidatus Omnitrophota bacterium]
MKNKAIADIFENMGTLLEIKGDIVFKVRAYHRAAEILSGLSEDIEALRKENRIDQLEGIGEALKGKICEYIDTGEIDAYEKLIQEIPETLLDIVKIPSVGPKKAKLFYDHLKIKDVDGLHKALDRGKLQGLPGIKEKTIENIKKGMKLLKEGQERMNLAWATEIAQAIVDSLKNLKEVKKITVAGSLRRQKETVRDIDILVLSSKQQKVMEKFIGLPQVARVLTEGETKSSILTKENVQVDLRVVEGKSFGAALLYFTGSKYFNVKLRQLAIKKKMKINEYGLFSVSGPQERFLGGRTEQEIFKKLGMVYLPPELREDIAEEKMFSLKKPLALIELKDIRGDLHVHSRWSDGRDTILQLAQAARKRGYSYLAVSDHSVSLKIAGGLSVVALKQKKKEIEQVNKKLKNFRVFFGAEVEIDTDGNIDYNNKILSAFDIVIAAIHSGFAQSSAKLTKRIIRACQNKYVHAIAHPTGAHFGKREPYDINLKAVCQAARETNTFLEINAFPIRMDLNSSAVYFAKNQGARFMINTDAHESDQLNFMTYGVSIARRGWLTKNDVVNTLTGLC